MNLSNIDEETMRAIVREEIALDEMRRLEDADRKTRCPDCRCVTGRTVPGGGFLSPPPGADYFTASGDAPR
jgi:hypothetical protein